MGGLCDYGVTPVPIGIGFGFWTVLGLDLGLRGPDLGLGLDNCYVTVLCCIQQTQKSKRK